MSAAIFTLVVLSIVTGTVSLTITRTYIFQRPRNWLRKRGQWWDKLVTCPYCLSHWIAMVLMAVYQPALLVLDPPLGPPIISWLLGLAITWLVMVFLSSLVTGLIWIALANIGPPPPLEEPKT